MNEGVHNMTRDQNTFGTKICPTEKLVGNIDTPIVGFLLHMGLKAEAVCPTRFASEKAFVIGPLVLKDDPTVNKEKGQKERRMCRQRISRVGHQNRRSRDHGLHFG